MGPRSHQGVGARGWVLRQRDAAATVFFAVRFAEVVVRLAPVLAALAVDLAPDLALRATSCAPAVAVEAAVRTPVERLRAVDEPVGETYGRSEPVNLATRS